MAGQRPDRAEQHAEVTRRNAQDSRSRRGQEGGQGGAAAARLGVIARLEDLRRPRIGAAALDGPAVLVGHSYGGAVITEAGNHPNVAALAYIAAYVPDQGESVGTLIGEAPADAPAPPILPPQGGFLFLDRDKFAAAFAADVPEKQAAFMADSQVGLGVDAVSGVVSEAAWRTKPSWYLVTTNDRMIPPAQQRAMSERAKATVTETPANHAVYVSQPAVVAQLIKQAADATG